MYIYKPFVYKSIPVAEGSSRNKCLRFVKIDSKWNDMKKIIFILFASLVLFSACETDEEDPIFVTRPNSLREAEEAME